VRKRRVEVAVVHRARYDDWSLPKGKLEPGERAVTAAVREVAEETGSRVALSRRLPTVRYAVGGARKEVSYWLARHVSGSFEPNDEVDELVWLPPAEARSRVDYPGDRTVLADTLRLPLPDAVIVLLRHARAGKRSHWTGDDALRPLERVGRAQAQALSGFLTAFGAGRVVSAEPVRCVETVTPFATSAGLTVRIDPRLGDHGFDADPAAAEQALLALARPGRVTAVASQGTAIPGLLDRLDPRARRPETKKGQAWVLSFVDGTLLAADHHPDAGSIPRP